VNKCTQIVTRINKRLLLHKRVQG